MTTDTLSAFNATAINATTSRARYLTTAARFLLGLIFFVCGLNGFLNFLPQPTEPMPEGAVAFGGALLQTGYMFPLIAGTELLAGVLLLCNRFVPLALVILAPVVINIFAFHVVLAPSGLTVAAVVLVLTACLAWTCRSAYRPLFKASSGSPQ